MSEHPDMAETLAARRDAADERAAWIGQTDHRPAAIIKQEIHTDGAPGFFLQVGIPYEEVRVYGASWSGFRAETPEAAMSAADAEIAGEWPRTGEWESVEVPGWRPGTQVPGWRALVDRAGQRRRAESWSNLNIYDDDER